TFQAESGVLGSGASIIYSNTNANGARVGNLGPTAFVTFNNVKSAVAGSNDLVIYYNNGDCSPDPRYFDISVNGGAPQRKTFPVVAYGDWNPVGQVKITLGGFVVGNNTVSFVGSAISAGPDLDWIEIVGASTVNSATAPGTCNRTGWTSWVSASQPSTSPASAMDGDINSRWTTGRLQDGTDWFAVDFGGLVKLSSITLSTPWTATNDYPGGYAIYGSADGNTFDTTPFVTGKGVPGKQTISFSQRTVHAVRIKQTGTANSSSWWSIGDFQAACSL
ncbi:MAG TPA: discoidin domain-containing protein, partial [Polyangia bacterium]|nr:discoidin domain-containing protein [Polyangia bacterium]